MKRLLLLVNAVFLSVILSPPGLNAASPWKYVGLKGENINTLYHLPHSEENSVMVGTDKGVWWFEYGTWWENGGGFAAKPLGLPVYAITAASSGYLLAAAGNGSDTDGVYLGEVAAIGEPGTLYRFSLLVKWPKPTALARTALDGGCTDKVYVGTTSGVAAGLLCNKTIDSLNAMVCPPNPFGGRCASIVVSAVDGQVYAGGNSYGIEFETGKRDTALLLKGTTELTQVKKMEVTSIVEYTSRGERFIAIATVDSGIQTFNNGVMRTFLPSPNQGEPVLSIIPFATQKYGDVDWTMLVAATPSGVYRQCPPDMDCIWSRFPDMPPGTPRCLEQFEGRILWAATDSGVYRYDYSTPVLHGVCPAAVASHRLSAARTSPGEVVFNFGEGNLTDLTLELFDLRGKCLMKSRRVSKHVTVSDVAGGIRVFRVVKNGRNVAEGKIADY